MKSRAIMAALAMTLATPAGAQKVVDGATINLNGTLYRLWGVDAPDLHQTCPDGYAAGIEASIELAKFMAGHTITCEAKTTDRHQHTVAICRADGEDIGAAMVRSGWAWAFLRHTQEYVEQEKAARSERLGVHSHRCMSPWEWRLKHKAEIPPPPSRHDPGTSSPPANSEIASRQADSLSPGERRKWMRKARVQPVAIKCIE